MDGGKFAVIGIGGCGMNLLQACLERLPEDTCGIAVNRDGEWLNEKDGVFHRIFLAEVSSLDEQGELLPVSREEVHASMQLHMAELTEQIQDRDTVYLLAGLGGATGTWASQALLERLQSIGKRVVTVLVLPFNFERKRLRRARESLSEFHVSDYLLICANQDLNQWFPAYTPLLDALDFMTRQICNAMHDLDQQRLPNGAYRMAVHEGEFEFLPVKEMGGI